MLSNNNNNNTKCNNTDSNTKYIEIIIPDMCRAQLIVYLRFNKDITYVQF